MDDSYEHYTQMEHRYSSYAFIYTQDEIYIMDHTTSYTHDLLV